MGNCTSLVFPQLKILGGFLFHFMVSGNLWFVDVDGGSFPAYAPVTEVIWAMGLCWFLRFVRTADRSSTRLLIIFLAVSTWTRRASASLHEQEFLVVLSIIYIYIQIYSKHFRTTTLWWCNIAIKNDPFIEGLPDYKMVISIVRLNCQRVNHPLFQEPMSEHKSWTHGYPAHASNATPDPACHPNRRDKLPDKCDESRHAMPEKSSALNLQKTFSRNGGLKNVDGEQET